MRQNQIDQLVRDIVTTLKTSGITAQRIIDWSKGRTIPASGKYCGTGGSRLRSSRPSPARVD